MIVLPPVGDSKELGTSRALPTAFLDFFSRKLVPRLPSCWPKTGLSFHHIRFASFGAFGRFVFIFLGQFLHIFLEFIAIIFAD